MIFEVEKGLSFYNALDKCKAEIITTGRKYMMMNFNDILITVSIDSNHDDLATIYDLKRKLQQYSINA